MKQKEKRKRERQKLMDKKRNLSSLVTDAHKRTQEFDRKVRITSLFCSNRYNVNIFKSSL